MTTEKAALNSTMNIKEKQQTNDTNLRTKSKISTSDDTAASFSTQFSFPLPDGIINYEDTTCTWLYYNTREFSSDLSVPRLNGNSDTSNLLDQLKSCFELGRDGCNAIVHYNPNCDASAVRCPSTFSGRIITDKVISDSKVNPGQEINRIPQKVRSCSFKL